ncbi:MAG TPA: hypothetical protein VFH80_16440 [Solirubrobacteraceae bacterium]|nr:hypothetical protein [Solirubrobacteraceae bacterium]
MSNGRSTALVAVLLGIVSVSIVPAASAKKPGGGGGGGGGGTSSSAAFVRTYSNLLGTTQFNVTPEDVQTTSDGGYIALGTTQSAMSGVGVSWLVKLSSTGSPQWQQELGCLGTPPGDYSDGVSIVQASDGGYVVGGGTIGCGSGSECPSTSGLTCALVEKVTSGGAVVWAKVYDAGALSSVINKIRQTSDGGLIAVGTTTDANHDNAGLVIKLDGQGNVQWQRQIGPGSTTQELLNAVQQTSDGGYVVAGQLEPPNATGQTLASVFVVRLDASGNVVWQQSYNSFTSGGSPSASNNALSIVQASDGGYLVAGNWVNAPSPGECCSGALLLRLDSAGAIEWQNALSGGLYCFFNGFSETCTNLTAVAYTAHQTADGGYVLTGDETLKLTDETPLEPWIAKVDASGNLVWQHLYYQTNKASGRPLSEYFASSAAASDGGFFGLGFTENVTNGDGELLAVKTDSAGNAGSSCSDEHPATVLNSTNPALDATATSLPVSAPTTPTASSPATATPTSINPQSDC